MLETTFNEFLNELIHESLSETPNPQFYVPSEREILRLKNNLISNTFIIYGPTGSGKTSSVQWAASFDPQIQIVLIDCQIDTTEIQFVRSIYFGIMGKPQNTKEHLQIQQDQIYLFENMKFDQLNPFIQDSGKKILFVIKKCQKIAEMKKPTLFYNLLEWINSSMKEHLGLVLISRAFHFTDKLEKRVKSRLTAKSLTLVRPQGQKIIQIYLKRFQTLKSKYEQELKNQKLIHKKIDPSIKTKMEWLQKIKNTVEHSEEFKSLVSKSINAINNQFVACMKLALIKSLQLEHLSKCSNNQFSNYFVSIMEEATEHIAPNFYKNLILQCPIYTVLVLSLVCYMGINEMVPYKMSRIFEIYKEKVLSSSKFNHLINEGSSKKFFEKAFNQLIDMRIISIANDNDDSGKDLSMRELGNMQLELAIPPHDLQDVISEMEELPEVIKEIVKN